MTNQNRSGQPSSNSGNQHSNQRSGLTKEQGMILVSLGIIATLIFVIAGLLFIMFNQNQPVQPVQVEATATDEIMVDSAVTATMSSRQATNASLSATGEVVKQEIKTAQAERTPLVNDATHEAIYADGFADEAEQKILQDAFNKRTDEIEAEYGEVDMVATFDAMYEE